MGSLKKEGGFTLIEILLSLLILSVGLVMVNKAILSSVTALSYVDTRNQVRHLLSKEIWKLEDEISSNPKSAPKFRQEILSGTDKTFNYEVRTTPISGNNLYKADLGVSWSQTGRQKELSRSYFILAQNEPKASQ